MAGYRQPGQRVEVDSLLLGVVHIDSVVVLEVEVVDFAAAGYRDSLVVAADMDYKVVDFGHLQYHLKFVVGCTDDRGTVGL
jgi:hypothetical protein